MRFLTADRILTPEGLQREMVLTLRPDGRVVSLEPLADSRPPTLERFEGILLPGFVNAHTHLELSHLHELIPRGAGLDGFGRRVMRYREEVPQEDRVEAAERAIRSLEKGGVVACGDIANTRDLFELKREAPIHLHTFVELLGTAPEKAEDNFAHFRQMLQEYHLAGLPASFAPHSAYGVSRELLELTYQSANPENGPLSIHLLESEAETELLQAGSGPLTALFEEFDLPLPRSGRDPVTAILPTAEEDHAFLFVHLLSATAEEVQRLRQGVDAHFCLCPKSNLYVQGQLPNLELFDLDSTEVCIGTDSLASNDRLDVLDELRVLQAEVPGLRLEQLLFFATRNGAEALGIDWIAGGFRSGLRPGILNLTDVSSADSLKHAKVSRLA